MKIDAIIWDYDGTLVNSAPKNIDTTKQILSDLVPRLSGKNLPDCLKSEKAYHEVNHKAKNWQDLYKNYFGLNDDETQKAGSFWAEYQLNNTTSLTLFSGIKEVINQLTIPHGICSQNSAEIIVKSLEKHNLREKFKAIIGYKDVPDNAQKPSPKGGIKCLKEIFSELKNKSIVYIGDHEGDVEFTRNLEKELCESNTIISIAATYSGADTKSWTFKPDFELSSPNELLDLVGT